MITTQLDKSVNISNHLDINLYVKRDDLFPLPGGGSKARKMNYILNKEVRNEYNAIVTTGSNQSNHLRAAALWASMLGWKIICIVHDEEPYLFEGNLKIVRLVGAELRFVDKQFVKEAMDIAMDDLREEGYNPFYIWGGGHSVEGAFAYYEAIKELVAQLKGKGIDYLFVPSGTGTTQAGIEIGVRQFMPNCKVIGVSVAREKQKGEKAVLESMESLNKFLNNSLKIVGGIGFDDRWIGDGYEGVYPELLEIIGWAAKKEGLILDPTYTGKAFYALCEYVKNKTIQPKANVLFWHTGGLFNLLASHKL